MSGVYKEPHAASGWPKVLPAAFYRGLAQFNSGAFFLCHETLEALWLAEPRDLRVIYQGTIQAAVGCYHLTVRRNWRGAVSLLNAGARRLERVWDEPPGHPSGLYDVHWARLIADSDRLRSHLLDIGIARVEEWDRALLPRILYASPYNNGAPAPTET